MSRNSSSVISLFRFSVDRREDSARDRQRVRHENKFAGPIADVLEFLLDLRHVLMRERLVGVKRIHPLRMMCVGRGLCAGT